MLFLCLLSACAHKPARPHAIPQPSHVPLKNPARDAQLRLLQEAHRAFNEARYPTAALFYKRFVDVAQDSPRLAEAHWWLARSYEHLGDFPAAMAQYRLVAAGALSGQVDGASYEHHALRRLDELYPLQAAHHKGQAARVALRVRVDQLPPIAYLSEWFKELAQAGVTAVALAPAASGQEGLGVELVREVTTVAHRRGVLLWVGLDLHQGQGMDVRPEWKATTRHEAGYEGGSASRLDVANPAYQSYLEQVIRTLARTGCDGVLLAARSTPGFAEEFSTDSLREFAASFGRKVSPDDIWQAEFLPEGKPRERSAPYWRWVGWKARSYGQLVMRLRKVLREHNHTATLSVEVHQSTLTAPLQGLEEFGEDVAELATRTGGSVVVRHEGTAEEGLLKKLGRQAGSPDRVWVGVAVKVGTSPPSMGELKASLAHLAEDGRWNMVVDVESTQPVP